MWQKKEGVSMKKEIYPSELLRKKRTKKHLDNSKSKIRRVRRENRAKNNRGFSRAEIDMSVFERLYICKEVIEANKKRFNPKAIKKITLDIPPVFDIFKQPESTLLTIFDAANKLMSADLNYVLINHKRVRKTSLASESLLALLVIEVVSNRREYAKEDITIKGLYPKSKNVKKIVDNIGMVKELTDNHFIDANDNGHESEIHYFRYDNRYVQSTSVKEDKKRQVAEQCVQYLESCMNAHFLTIRDQARDKLKACLGEVLDNAEEHCSRTKAIWFVRGYFNDVEDERYLELSVFNFGNSIFENFNQLSQNSKIKNAAKTYVDRHSNNTDKKALFTVAALQGNISSKKDLDPTRGQGSVTLIETFELMHRSYKKLRASEDDLSQAQMNIISGDTVIVFDGKHQSSVEIKEDGSEQFLMPFNAETSLKHPPDSDNVYTMKNLVFPGVMINIRIPLQGSTVPLKRTQNES